MALKNVLPTILVATIAISISTTISYSNKWKWNESRLAKKITEA